MKSLTLFFCQIFIFVSARRNESLEILFPFEDRKERKSDVDNSEDERRRLSIGSLKKKALNASSRLTHSLKRKGKRKLDHRASNVSIEDVRDEEEEKVVFMFQQELLSRNLLPDWHNDYHMLLRYYLFFILFCSLMIFFGVGNFLWLCLMSS
jgi:hypothetical protein